MSNPQTFQIQEISAHPGPVPGQGTQRAEEVCKYIDVTTCIGCKACEVACVETGDRSIRRRQLRMLCTRCRSSRLCTYRLLRRAAFPALAPVRDGPRFPEFEMSVDCSSHALLVRQTLVCRLPCNLSPASHYKLKFVGHQAFSILTRNPLNSGV